jgi:dihydroorotate dehydrogenase (fumarate)
MTNLTTRYLGLDLKNPIVASPSPLCQDVDNVRKMEDVGLAAVVLHSLFEEQITIQSLDLDRYLDHGSESFAESLTYFPDMQSYNLGPEAYLEHIRKCKEAVDFPVIASLNGYSSGGWIEYARLMEEAGADALELNIYYMATDPRMSGREVESMYVDLVSNVTAGVRIPVAVKLSPYFSATANMAQRLVESGARGLVILVIFNRFYQPDIDLEKLEVVPNLVLSSPDELRLRLRWAAILFDQVGADLAITGGVHSAFDVVKSMMAGAKIAMTTSALLRRGIDWGGILLEDLDGWLVENEYESIEQMQGSMSLKRTADPTAFERANYMNVLRSYAMNDREASW